MLQSFNKIKKKIFETNQFINKYKQTKMLSKKR